MALAFAQYIVCEKVREEGGEGRADACGKCPSCLKAVQLIHPDIHYSYPVIPKKSGDKPVSTDYATEWREFMAQHPYGNAYDWLQYIGAENKQGNITAQECNEIIRMLSLKSFESGYKILIMWMPEYLGNEGNKLLKLIEEPPANTLFLLVAENESLILPTILSRVQLVKILLPEVEEIAGALVAQPGPETGKSAKGEAQPGLSAEQARQVAILSEGNYRVALQLTRQADDDWQGVLREWLNAILRTGPVAQVKWIEEIAKSGRERQKQFLRYFNHLLEQAIRLRYLEGRESEGGRAEVGSRHEDSVAPAVRPEGRYRSAVDAEKDFALRLNKIADIAQQRAIIEELDRAAYYIERNAHAKMLFHALTIKLYHILAEKMEILVR
jgi:DNA polymerase-3 subunit delta'